MVNDKHSKVKTKRRVITMTAMYTDESEANEDGDILASAGANASKKEWNGGERQY